MPNNAFASMRAALAGDDEDSRAYRFEAKKRGMSDVDDSNLK